MPIRKYRCKSMGFLWVMLLLVSPSKLNVRHRQCSYALGGMTTAGFAQATQIDRRGVLESGTKLEVHDGIALPDHISFQEILFRAGMKSLGGGLPGALAGMVQVVTLMWLRTIINYQCRYGTSFTKAFSKLMKEGGIPRLYKGLPFAIIQAPLAKFGSTAANEGVQSLLASLAWSKEWGVTRTTFVASCVVGLWRMFLMPIDTMKTVLQVESSDGFRNLIRRVRSGHVGALYSGALANAFSAIVGHYPWFLTYNFLKKSMWVETLLPSKILRNAIIALIASVITDTVVNALRVVKTTKQSLAAQQSQTYFETIRTILATDGWRGLFGRSLKTRMMANALQSILFTIVWRGLAERWSSTSHQNQPIFEEVISADGGAHDIQPDV